ncbi:MAG: 50S ribosomal protein L4 [Candidatus Micrarchaeaceae archaeon]
MLEADVLDTDGRQVGRIQLPNAFSERVRPDLIRRAVLAERSSRLQPQGHFPLAGMQTTAAYYGKMNSYRSGRHMGQALRPKEKLGGGRQGKVRRIPSAVTGKRAHPHQIEKKIVELINKREYSKAIASAIAATVHSQYSKRMRIKDIKLPIVFSDAIESITKTKEFIKVVNSAKIGQALEQKATAYKGKRHMSRAKSYKKSILVVVGKDNGISRAARNIAGVDVCTIDKIKAELLAPGGDPGRLTVWSKSALESCDSAIEKAKVV